MKPINPGPERYMPQNRVVVKMIHYFSLEKELLINIKVIIGVPKYECLRISDSKVHINEQKHCHKRLCQNCQRNRTLQYEKVFHSVIWVANVFRDCSLINIMTYLIFNDTIFNHYITQWIDILRSRKKASLNYLHIGV